MLLAFVLLGRAVEERAKLQATSDMTALLNFLPSKARLVMGLGTDGHPTTVNVPCDSLSVGDSVVVLPGVRFLFITITLYCFHINILAYEVGGFITGSNSCRWCGQNREEHC